MEYGRMILNRVDAAKGVKEKFTVVFTKEVYDEFRRKCGDRAPSHVLEEMLRHFNETTPEPSSKKPRK